MKQLFQNLNTLRVLAFFFDFPREKEYLRSLARRLKMSPATVLRVLELLVNAGLVERLPETRGAYYRASFSPYFCHLKTAYSLEKFSTELLASKVINSSSAVNAVILYGSVAKGEDDAASDIDLLVIAKKCGVSSAELSEIAGKQVSLKVVSLVEWSKLARTRSAFYWEVIASGIMLYGEKPVV